MAENFIIKTKNKGYFAGWGQLGDFKYINEKRLAYRFSKPLALKNIEKIVTNAGCTAEIMHI